MKPIILFTLFLVLAFPSIAGAQSVTYPVRTDPMMTPGATLPVTREDICVAGYSKSVRHVSAKLKMRVYREYGLRPDKQHPCEIDHDIPLCLGGSNDLLNLWPESYEGEWNAHLKDKLENFLHLKVCSGDISLQEAQREISSGWISAYIKYVNLGELEHQ